jgi:hypothetical protein
MRMNAGWDLYHHQTFVFCSLEILQVTKQVVVTCKFQGISFSLSFFGKKKWANFFLIFFREINKLGKKNYFILSMLFPPCKMCKFWGNEFEDTNYLLIYLLGGEFPSFTNVFEKNLKNEFFFFTLVRVFFFSILWYQKFCWMLPQKLAKLYGFKIEKKFQKKKKKKN